VPIPAFTVTLKEGPEAAKTPARVVVLTRPVVEETVGFVIVELSAEAVAVDVDRTPVLAFPISFKAF
jgi:hypothetical protein